MHRNARQLRRPGRRFERLESRAMLAVNGDFNGDGYDDLAASAVNEVIGGITQAGAVSIIYGSPTGLKAAGNQFWHLNSPGVNGIAAMGDTFGYSLAVGDFNGDDFSDLAIGIPSKTINGKSKAGAVSVLYGSSSGLQAGSVDQLWTQDSPSINDSAEVNDFFGEKLAAGDFNGDGRDDLAIGVTNESVGTATGAGMVNVLYGSANGLTNKNDQHWHQNSSGINDTAEQGDQFAGSLSAGDFNGDGRDDLAVGVRFEDLGALNAAGAVNVIYGSANGLSGSGDQFWTQDSPGVADDAETSDQFSYSMAAGDFNGDGYDELAIGAATESVGTITFAGRVNLLYGSSSKLTSSGGVKQLTAESVGSSSTQGSTFGHFLVAGDFNDDGRDDLALSSGESVLLQDRAGVVYVMFGSSSLGLSSTGVKRWQQSDFGGIVEEGDYFGATLVTADYDGDGRSDLAIGAANDGDQGMDAGGNVSIVYSYGLIDPFTPTWHQNLLNSSDGVETFDAFGSALG